MFVCFFFLGGGEGAWQKMQVGSRGGGYKSHIWGMREALPYWVGFLAFWYIKGGSKLSLVYKWVGQNDFWVYDWVSKMVYKWVSQCE